MKLPKVYLLGVSSVQSIWKAKFPSTSKTEGAVYRVNTYNGSNHIYITTWIKRRPVSELVGRRISADIREALRLYVDQHGEEIK